MHLITIFKGNTTETFKSSCPRGLRQQKKDTNKTKCLPLQFTGIKLNSLSGKAVD